MKVALVIGHHKNSKGALSKYFGVREFDFYSDVITYMTSEFDVYHHNHNIGGYTTRIKDTAKRLNKKEYDLVIELHFNSFFKPTANGCETLYYYASKKGLNYAKMFSKHVASRTGIKLRHGGIKSLSNRHDRGFASVYYPKAPTILIEPFFGSSNDDCSKIESVNNMACILDDFICNLN